MGSESNEVTVVDIKTELLVDGCLHGQVGYSPPFQQS